MTNSYQNQSYIQKRILVADDNPINREISKKILENYNFKVTTASNGEEALEHIFNQNSFNLILLDINMPKLTGIEVATIIRKSINNEIKKLPIVALTGNESKKEIQEIYESGINSYIAKPAPPSKLIEVINNTIENPDKFNIAVNNYSAKEPNIDHHFQDIHQQEIDIKKGVFFVGNDPAIFKKLLLRFLDTSSDSIDKIKDIIKQNDHQGAIFSIHNLKGVSAQICAFRFHKIVKNFEGKIQKSLDNIEEKDIENLESSFLEVINSIKTILDTDKIDIKGVNKNLKKDIQYHKKKEAIEIVVKAIETGKINRIEESINRLKAYISTEKEKEILSQLDDLIEKYDFKNAFLKAKALLSFL